MRPGFSLESGAVLIGDAGSPATAELVQVFRRAGARVFVAAARDPELEASWIAADGLGAASVFDAMALEQEALHSLVAVLHGPATEPRSVADRAFDVVEAIKQSTRRFGAPPRHIVVMHCEREPGEQLGPRLLGTLTRYLSAHLSGRPTHINLVSHDATPLAYQRAAQCALALCSGWLDAMNGQRIEVGGLE